MALKPIRIEYLSRINALTGAATTGLTNVKAQIYIDGVAKAVGNNAVALTELDSTNAPGVYEVIISAAMLTGWGASVGQNLVADINSASANAPAVYKQVLSAVATDDLATTLGTPAGASVSADIAAVQTKLGTPAGASVSADVAAVKSDTAAIKYDLEAGSANLATILAGIQQINNGTIGNGVGYVLPEMLIPASGSNTYKIPITILNNDGANIDPTNQTVTVGVQNAGGQDRGSYLTGSAGTPATVAATRAGVGQYSVALSIPSSAPQEELIFSFSYTVGSNAMVRFGQALVQTDTNAAGYALQSTLLATQTAVNAIKADVENASTGLVAIDNILANGTYGNQAIQAYLANSTFGLPQIQGFLNNGTYGLPALQAYLANGTYGLPALQQQNVASQGTGFVSANDSLHAISQQIQALASGLYSGGRAV